MKLILMRKLVFLCALQLSCLYVSAQQETKTIKDAVVKTDSNNLVVEILTPGKSTAEVLQYKEEFLQCGPNINFELNRSQKDLAGNDHFYYQQYINNIPVLYGEMALHVKNSSTYLITGNYINKNEESAPQLPPISGIKISRASDKVRSLYSGNITDKPTGNLQYSTPTVIFSYLKDDDRKDFLKYKACIVVDTELKNWESYRVILDYETLNIIKIIPLFQSGCANDNRKKRTADKPQLKKNVSKNAASTLGDCTQLATLNTLFNGGGYQKNTTKVSPTSYILSNDCNATPFKVENGNRDTLGFTGNITTYTDTDNAWPASEGTQLFWGLGRTLDYFKVIFNRSGMINNNTLIQAYANWAYIKNSVISGNNATHFQNHKMIFGYGFDSLNADDDIVHLDVASHEFAHGVTQETTNMAYYSQAGAINESLSDIFAKTTHAYNNGGSVSSWLIQGSPTWTIRSLSNPGTYGHPSYYKGANWLNTDTCSGQPAYDNCGVHINSGVMNYWFYRLVTGGTFTDPNGVTVTIPPMLITKAEKIVYQAYNYFGNNPNYAASRNATIQAARDLYGNCSAEAIQVGKAWIFAGVGQLSAAYDRFRCGTQSSGSLSAVRNLTMGEVLFCTTATIPTGTTFYASAGNAIIMRPTFIAQTGSFFNAAIGGISDCLFQELN